MLKKSLISTLLSITLLISIFSVSIPAGITSSGESGGGGSGGSSYGSTDIIPPSTMVTHLTNTNENSDKRECVLDTTDNIKKAYLNYDDVVGHGQSEDNYAVKGVRTILDNNAPNNGVADDGLFNENSETWQTGTFYFNLAEGKHKLWGIATDSKGNNESISNSNLCEFCIDKQAPLQPSKPILIRTAKEVCDPNFINNVKENVKFTWNALDNGCAGVSFFDVFVEIDRNGIISFFNIVESNSFIIPDLADGERARIKVRTNDKAGNIGEWSEFSDWVTIDNTTPDVEIITELDDWISGDFTIEESDRDDNLWKCFYKVTNNGILTTPKSSKDNDYVLELPSCNAPLSIDVDLYCPQDGECKIFKKARDRACNNGHDNKIFHVDNHSPELTKTIVEGPSYNDGEFVTTNTIFEINATETGSGMKQLCYVINDEVENCIDAKNSTTALLSTRFNFEQESEHTITFWGIDNLGHRTQITQTHFVEEMPPVTTKEYINLLQEVKDWVTNNFEINDFTFDWLGLNSKIMLTAEDPVPHPSGVDETLFKMFELSDDEDSEDSEWYGIITQKWYDNIDTCEDANPEEILINDIIANNNCIEVSGWFSENGWQTYNPETKIMLSDESNGAHKICFKSEDNLGNEEEQQCQVFFIDNSAPSIEILNPTFAERQVKKCAQSIVALVDDEGSGVNRVWAELWNTDKENEQKVREADMVKTIYGTYEAFMNKELPAGDYVLKVFAEDNVGNVEEIGLDETLLRSVFVEFISPAQCSINPVMGGSCEFTFNLCMRDADSTSFWLNKLGGIITPDMMNAEISRGNENTFVGLSQEDFLSDAGLLKLDDELIDGRTSFNLHLDIPADVAGTIGKGVHPLDFSIKSFKE